MDIKKLLARFRRNAAEAPDAPPAADTPKERDRGLSVPKVGLALTLAMLAVVGAAGVAAYVQFEDGMAESQALAARARGAQVAAALSGRARSLGDVVARLAQDPLLIAAVRSGDDVAIRAQTALVSRAVPAAMRALVVPRSMQDPDSTLAPPVGYACLDLVRTAETGGVPPVEVHSPGSEAQHIDIVRPIPGGDAPLASLMVTLAAELVQDWLREAMADVQGSAELAQQGAGKPVPIAAAGGARGGVSETMRVPGTSWQLTYWAPPVAVMPEVREFAFISVFAAAAAVLASLALGGFLWLGRLLRRDLAQMADHVVEMSHGKRHHSVSMKLLEVQKAVRMIDEALPLPRHPQSRSEPKPPAESAYSAADDDLGDPLFTSAMVVEEERGPEA